MNRFAVAFVAVTGLGLVSQHASAGVEVGGVAGLHVFSEDNALGTDPNQNLKHANSALFAIRLGFMFTSMLGAEVEGGLIPTESAGTNVPKFDIYNAVVRAQVIAQFRNNDPSNKVLPFVLAGFGGINIADVSTTDTSLIEKETDYYGYIGGGAKYRAGGGWGVRLDVRGILVPTKEESMGLDFEVLASLYRDFGYVAKPKKPEPKADPDPDGDGITASDQCPNEPEDKDTFEDENGCPDTDNDKDEILDSNDKCPLEAEDKDNFEDDNGCPDPDNDGDGVADASDKCIDQPETKNGFEDEDGCPDEIPAKLAKFTGSIQGINFKTASADLAGGSTKVLDKAVAVLTEFKDVKLEISGHTDDVALKNTKKFADNDALSQARAESVKAYFVKKGIAEDRLVAKGYGSSKPITDPAGLKGGKLNKARAQNRRVEFTLIPAEGGAEAPKAEEPKAEEKTEPKAEEKKAEPKAEEKKAEPKADEKKEEKTEEKKE